MSQNLVIDPKKRDYVFVNGSPLSTDRIFEKAYYAIVIPRDQWLYGNPGQGSLVHTLQNVKRSASIEQQLASYIDTALQDQLINTGEAQAQQVTSKSQTTTTSENNIQIVPAQNNITDQFNFTGV